MTVEELIETLKTMPQDALVRTRDDEGLMSHYIEVSILRRDNTVVIEGH